MADEQLLEAITQDPDGGIRLFLDEYGDRLRGRLRAYARERSQGERNADDVLQEATLRLLDPDVRSEIRTHGGQVLPYLSRWAYWRLDDLAEKGAREARRFLDATNADLPHSPSLSAVLVGKLTKELSSRDQAILTWRYRERLTSREVAERLGISEGAAKKAAHDARQRLRSLLENEGVRFD